MSFNGKLSAVTFSVEFAAFIYFIYRYVIEAKNDARIILSLSILFFLSMYQLSEVITCAFEKREFGKGFGHIAITLLPTLGLFLTNSLEAETYYTEYIFGIACVMYVAYFVIRPQSVELVACKGFFVQYRYSDPVTTYYGFYYNGALLLAMIFLGIISSANVLALYLLIGYISFTFPTALLLILKKISEEMTTSVMCQWAFFLSILLIFFLNALF